MKGENSTYFVRYEKTLDITYWLANNMIVKLDPPIIIYRYYTGMTYAIIADSGCLYIGVSRCSKRDNFDKKIARQIAIGRAEASRFDSNRLVCFTGNIYMTRSTWELLDKFSSIDMLPETLLKMIEGIEKSNHEL